MIVYPDTSFILSLWHSRDRFGVCSFPGDPPGSPGGVYRRELRKLHKPDHADNRLFYTNRAMNDLTKKDYEFAGISNNDVMMKKFTAR